MDELEIEKAHVMGLSQGGFLAQMIAQQFPDRILTCVSAGTTFDRSGIELAMLSEGAEEFFDKIKAAGIFDEDWNPPWDYDSVSKEEYVEWKMAMLGILVPGFPEDLLRRDR